MIAGYVTASPIQPQQNARQALQPGQWPGFHGRALGPHPGPHPAHPTAPGHPAPFAPTAAFAGPSFTQPATFAHPAPALGHAQPMRRSEGQVRQLQRQDAPAPRVVPRTTNLSQTFARMQQELQANVLHETVKSEDMPMPHFEHVKPEPYAYLERRLQWIQEDLQRQQTRLVDQSVPKQAPAQERMSKMTEMLKRLQVERKNREDLENKISGLESTLMKERAEHNLCIQQMRTKYEKVLKNIDNQFQMQMKSQDEQLMSQSHRLDQIMQDVFGNLETQFTSTSQPFHKNNWVPITMDGAPPPAHRGTSPPPPGGTSPGTHGATSPGETSTTPSWFHVARGEPRRDLPRPNFGAQGKTQIAMVSGPVVPPGRQSKSQVQAGGSLRVPKGAMEEPQMSGKAVAEMLQKLHQENQELQRVNQELSQQKSRKGSKDASLTHSPIQTPGQMCPQWPRYRPAG